MKITTIVFDMDGVIIDSEPIHHRTLSELFFELGIQISSQEFNSFIGSSTRNMWESLKLNHSLKRNIKDLIQLDETRYLDFLTKIEKLKPIEGVEKWLKYARENGFKVVLASSASQKNIDLVLSKLDFPDYFDLIVSGAELENSKPHPEIFLRAALKIDSLPEDCLVIEDAEKGIEAAIAARMFCLGFENKNSGSQDLSKSTYSFDSFVENNLDQFTRKIERKLNK